MAMGSCRTSPRTKPTPCSRRADSSVIYRRTSGRCRRRVEPTDDPERREEKLVSIIPRNIRRIYNARKILDWVLDKDSFFEIQPHWGKSRITGLARVDGYPVGVMINNQRENGGSPNKNTSEKIMRMISLCETFHLPLIYFCDEP